MSICREDSPLPDQSSSETESLINVTLMEENFRLRAELEKAQQNKEKISPADIGVLEQLMEQQVAESNGKVRHNSPCHAETMSQHCIILRLGREK